MREKDEYTKLLKKEKTGSLTEEEKLRLAYLRLKFTPDAERITPHKMVMNDISEAVDRVKGELSETDKKKIDRIIDRIRLKMRGVTKLQERDELAFEKEIRWRANKMLNLYPIPKHRLTLMGIHYHFWRPLHMMSFSSSRGFDPLVWIALGIKSYIDSDFDYLMMINGLEGTGKSSLSIRLAYYLKAVGLRFNLMTNVFFRTTPVEYILMMIEKLNRQVFIFDEARAQFWKRTFANKTQRDLIMSIVMQRFRNHVYLLNTRQTDDIDMDLRNSRVASTLYIIDRGLAAFLINTSHGSATKDPFYFDHLIKSSRVKDKIDILYEIMKLPSFVALIKYDKLPPKIEEAYKVLKAKLNVILEENFEYTTGLTKKDIINALISDEEALQRIAQKLKMPIAILKLHLAGLLKS